VTVSMRAPTHPKGPRQPAEQILDRRDGFAQKAQPLLRPGDSGWQLLSPADRGGRQDYAEIQRDVKENDDDEHSGDGPGDVNAT
jgi:hypothetical protein